MKNKWVLKKRIPLRGVWRGEYKKSWEWRKAFESVWSVMKFTWWKLDDVRRVVFHTKFNFYRCCVRVNLTSTVPSSIPSSVLLSSTVCNHLTPVFVSNTHHMHAQLTKSLKLCIVWLILFSSRIYTGNFIAVQCKYHAVLYVYLAAWSPAFLLCTVSSSISMCMLSVAAWTQ